MSNNKDISNKKCVTTNVSEENAMNIIFLELRPEVATVTRKQYVTLHDLRYIHTPDLGFLPDILRTQLSFRGTVGLTDSLMTICPQNEVWEQNKA